MKDRIKELRNLLGLSHADFGKKIGLEAGTIYSWERTGKVPEAKLQRIAKAFRVSYEWLLYGKGAIFKEGSEGTDDDGNGLAERLKKLRKAVGLTQEEFAKKIDVNGTSITGWEKNGRIPLAKRQLIAKTYNARITWLETGEGEMFEAEAIMIPPREFALRNGCDEISATLFERFMGLSEAEKKAFSRTLLQIVSGKDLAAAGQQIQIEEGSGSASNTGGIVLKGLIKTRDITVNNYKDPDEK